MSDVTLLPLDTHLTSFFASFSVQGKTFDFSFFNVPSPSASGETSLKEAKIKCEPEIRRLLSGFESILEQRLNQSTDLLSFILELKDILESVGASSTKPTLPSANFYEAILAEIDCIGWDTLSYVGTDLRQLNFQIFDRGGREHIIQVTLPLNYPKVQPMVSTDLPGTIQLHWHKDANLKMVIEQYEEAIQKYQDFWAVMEDIDKKFWILEPEHPCHSNTFRRIAIGKHCSISITIDPLAPYAIPECRFLGSNTIIGPIQRKLSKNIHKWNTSKILSDNLMEVLDMVFPSREENVHENMSINCGICYAFRLCDDADQGEGSVPDRACDNGNCGQPFHTNCLVEWLRSITTTRQSFDVLFGNCPYCSHPLAVKQSSST